MSRSAAFSRLRNYIRLAQRCERTGTSAREALEEYRETSDLDQSRRRLLAAMGTGLAVTAVGGLPGVARNAVAAPRIAGNVAVVGAGLAGLACADALAAKGIATTVYEASDRVGGRCYSLPNFFPGQVAERGGEFIDTGHVTMRGYANALGLTLENVTKQPGEIFYFIDGQLYDEAQIVEEFRAFVPVLREDAKTLSSPTADAFTAADRVLDFTNLEDYLVSRGAGTLIRQVLDVAYKIEYGRETREQSSIALLLFIHADRRSKFAPFGVFSDERFHVVEGNERIASGLAAHLPQGVRLRHELVAARKLTSGRIRLTLRVDGRSAETDHDAVVLTLPFSVLRNVDLHDSLALPTTKRYAIDNLLYGTNSKMMIGFSGRPWVSIYGSNGASYSDLANHQTTWETNPLLATAGRAILTDYSGGLRGASLDPNRAQFEAAQFLSDLDRIYSGASAFATRDARGELRVHLENWSLNPLSLGSYTCNAPGYFTTIAGNEAKAVGNLFFAGEHTDSFYSWQGFMEGAALSGLRAAKEVYTLLAR